MTEALQNFQPHENLARDAYWGSPQGFVTVAAAGRLATAELDAFAHIAGASDVVTTFRKMYTFGNGFTGHADYVPDNQLPVLDDSTPGILQVVHDERITFKDPKGRTAKRAASDTCSAEEFDETALGMEKPGVLHSRITYEAEPGVLVSRGVWYARAIHLPFGVRPPERYSGLRHIVVPSGQMATQVNPLRRRTLTPFVSGNIHTRLVRAVEDRSYTKLSRVALTMHLTPEGDAPGGGKPAEEPKHHARHLLAPRPRFI
jgi:hypothetical protein